MDACTDERAIFQRHCDRFSRLSLSSFIEACAEIHRLRAPAPAPARSANDVAPEQAHRPCTADSFTERWPNLGTNGRTAMEKRELCHMVQVLRARVAELEAANAAESMSRSTALQQSNEELERELRELRAEVEAERVWLEHQLREMDTSHLVEQSQMRRELQGRHQARLESEIQSKEQLRSELETRHSTQLAMERETTERTRQQLEKQRTKLEAQIAAYVAAERRLQLELEQERGERERLQAYFDALDVEKLRQDCREAQRELAAESERFRVEGKKAWAEAEQLCKELQQVHEERQGSMREIRQLTERLNTKELELIQVNQEASEMRKALKKASTVNHHTEQIEIVRQQYTLPEGYVLVPELP